MIPKEKQAKSIIISDIECKSLLNTESDGAQTRESSNLSHMEMVCGTNEYK